MFHTERNGSVSLEAALTFPLIFTVFIFVYGLLETFLLYNYVSEAMYKTADFIIDYGVVYHEKGINKLSETVLKEFGEKLDLSEIVRRGDDLLYNALFEEVLRKELEKDSLYREIFKDNVSWSLSGSNYFNGNDTVYLNGYFKYDYYIPFFENFVKGFSFKKSISVRSFIDGETIALSETVGGSIWQLSNFERGRFFQEMFGRNLPEFYPVIDSFEKGTVKIIVSINHTLDSYQNSDNFQKRLDKVLSMILNFNGESYGGVTISSEDIKSRKIVIVFPEDSFSDSQQTIIDKFSQNASAEGVEVQLQRYDYVN